MKRFDQLLSGLPLPLQPSVLPIGLDMGSSTTRVRVENSLRLQQPTCAITHGQNNDLLAFGAGAAHYQLGLHKQAQFKAPVRKGVLTDTTLGIDYLKAVLNQVIRPQELGLLTRVAGVCLIPSQATKVEQFIFQKVFDGLGIGQWRFEPKANVWQRLLTSKKYAALAGCIDIGGDTTEVLVIDNQVVMAKTIPFGGRFLVKRLLQLIRAELGFQLSWDSGERLLTDFDLGALSSSKKPTQIAVRGKNMTSGRPETLVVSSDVLKPVVMTFYEELFDAIRLFFATIPTGLLTKSMDSGLLLTGGLSQVMGSMSHFEAGLNASVVLSETPQEDLIRHIW